MLKAVYLPEELGEFALFVEGGKREFKLFKLIPFDSTG